MKSVNGKLIPLSEIDDKRTFHLGNRFRQYEIGLNVESKEDDYYEYMLCEMPGEREHMLLICCEGYKAGIALAYAKTNGDKSTFLVNAKAIKFSLGIKNVYFKEE